VSGFIAPALNIKKGEELEEIHSNVTFEKIYTTTGLNNDERR